MLVFKDKSVLGLHMLGADLIGMLIRAAGSAHCPEVAGKPDSDVVSPKF